MVIFLATISMPGREWECPQVFAGLYLVLVRPHCGVFFFSPFWVTHIKKNITREGFTIAKSLEDMEETEHLHRKGDLRDPISISTYLQG